MMRINLKTLTCMLKRIASNRKESGLLLVNIVHMTFVKEQWEQEHTLLPVWYLFMLYVMNRTCSQTTTSTEFVMRNRMVGAYCWVFHGGFLRFGDASCYVKKYCWERISKKLISTSVYCDLLRVGLYVHVKM